MEYRAYVIDDDGYISCFDKMTCRDDAEALETAGHLMDGHDIEVWAGPRLVTVISGEGYGDVLDPEGRIPQHHIRRIAAAKLVQGTG